MGNATLIEHSLGREDVAKAVSNLSEDDARKMVAFMIAREASKASASSIEAKLIEKAAEFVAQAKQPLSDDMVATISSMIVKE